MSAHPVSPTEISKLYLKITESPDAVANQLFIDCFRLMDQGNYREAGSKLVAFMEGKAFSDHKPTMPPAWWLLAWCILKEGGNKNLLDAAERFWICANLPGIGKHEDLAKAAVFNRAVIYADLLNTDEGEKKKYTENAVESLNLFLQKWPHDPQSSEVRNMLDSLNAFHPRP
jgi:outer membrane protein assembly factor BamD (BamD/ComL family)